MCMEELQNDYQQRETEEIERRGLFKCLFINYKSLLKSARIARFFCSHMRSKAVCNLNRPLVRHLHSPDNDQIKRPKHVVILIK